MEITWEQAEIKYRIMEDPYSGAYSGPGYSASLQFIARVRRESGRYEVGESLRMPIALPAGASRIPLMEDAQHLALHRELVEQLQREGWELLHERGEQWWQLRFRRPYTPQASIWQRLRDWLAQRPKNG